MIGRALLIACLVGIPVALAAGDPAPVAERLADADVQRGERLMSKHCAAACHTYKQGAGARVGPNLWDVVGRPMTTKEGYRYSTAMRHRADDGGTWTYEALDTYLTSPRKFVPGTSMTFIGLKNPQERADIILFLRSLSNNPQPLPPSHD